MSEALDGIVRRTEQHQVMGVVASIMDKEGVDPNTSLAALTPNQRTRLARELAANQGVPISDEAARGWSTAGDALRAVREAAELELDGD
ncbi:MAG: hypothetical protein PHS62_00745 [Patescibacteria group bacterium]|nr:hypothetical protein [Patescibacteria group bacterium]